MDVDAVSVATYDIDRSGRLPLWSKYANLESLEALNESMKHPFPTGEDINFISFDEKPLQVQKIISGGQTGTDMIGLEVGKELGFTTGGTAPKGYMLETGVNEQLLKSFGLEEISDANNNSWQSLLNTQDTYSARTYQNVNDADGTVYFDFDTTPSPGHIATQKAAELLDKPFIVNPDADTLLAWMQKHSIKTLNIAGNRDSKMTESQKDDVRRTLRDALSFDISADRAKFEQNALNYTISLFEKYVGPGKLFEINTDQNGDFANISMNKSMLPQIGEFIRELSQNLLYQLTDVSKSEIRRRFPDYLNTDKSVQKALNTLKHTVDSYNHYFDKMSKSKLESIAKNFAMYEMYTVINDPSNMMQAMSSVDAMTAIPKKIGNKSRVANISKSRTAGNFVNKAEGIVENQVGREAIGICATGMKAFFGLTSYFNKIANEGTESQQKRLLLGSEGKGIQISTLRDGKVVKLPPFKLLANTLERIANNPRYAELQKALNEVDNDKDAALLLSAMLSLATD